MCLNQPALLERRADEIPEQRVRIERLGFQFGVELDADVPWMVLELDDFRQASAAVMRLNVRKAYMYE